MRQLVERSFDVDVPVALCWDAMVDAETWPIWAHHIARIEVNPPGAIGPCTRARIVLTNRTAARVAVVAFDEGRRFCWVGSFLWLGLSYDHVVEPAEDGRSLVTFTVGAEGRGVGSIGRLFGRVYGRKLDRAIPRLQARLGALRTATIS
jgi:hypothetical protein